MGLQADVIGEVATDSVVWPSGLAGIGGFEVAWTTQYLDGSYGYSQLWSG